MTAAHIGRRTAVVLAATAAMLATVLTPANAQSPTAPGKPAITMTVEHGIQSCPDGPGLVFRWPEVDDGGSAIIHYEVRHRTLFPRSAQIEPVEWDYSEYPRQGGNYEFAFLTYGSLPMEGTRVMESVLEFRVRAWNSVGAGPWSETARYPDFHLLYCSFDSGHEDDVGPPTVPLSVSAIPGDGYVTLSWNMPSSDGGSPVTAYEVGYRRAERNGSYYTKATAATSITVVGLVNDVDYEMFVRARNAYGASSWTETLQARPVGSQGSELAAELLELINFLDEVLGLIDGDETPTDPVVGDCPRGEKYSTKSLAWWPSPKTRWQIVATESWKLSDGTRVNRGDPGGKVKYKSGTLFKYGCAWAFDGSKIEDSATVRGDAIVKGNAIVTDDAEIYGRAVIGSAVISGQAEIAGDADVYGEAQVYGNAKLYGNAKVYEQAKVYGNAEVYGNSRVCGNAEIFGNAHVNLSSGDDCKIRGNAKIFGEMQITSEIYDGVQEYTRDAKEIFRDQYTTFYNTLIGCKHGVREAHTDALELASGNYSYLLSVISECDRLESMHKIVKEATPQGWDVVLAAAGFVRWPAQIEVVLNLANLVTDLGTLSLVQRELGEQKGSAAWDMNEELQKAYEQYIQDYKKCSKNFFSSKCLEDVNA